MTLTGESDVLGEILSVARRNNKYWHVPTVMQDVNSRCSSEGLEVACWPLVLKLAGSNPAEAVGFLRVNKNPQHVGGHGCLSVVIVVCCQVEVSATN